MPRAKEKYGGVHTHSLAPSGVGSAFISLFILYCFGSPGKLLSGPHPRGYLKENGKKKMLFITNEVNSTVSSKRAGNVRDFRSLSLGF